MKPRALAVDSARNAWGEELPGWVLALANLIDRVRSSRRAGERIGYSAGLVSQVINRRYGGKLEKIEAAVRGALMAEEVDCPVLGPIGRDRCVGFQNAPKRFVTPEDVKLWRACRGGCRHSFLNTRENVDAE